MLLGRREDFGKPKGLHRIYSNFKLNYTPNDSITIRCSSATIRRELTKITIGSAMILKNKMKNHRGERIG